MCFLSLQSGRQNYIIYLPIVYMINYRIYMLLAVVRDSDVYQPISMDKLISRVFMKSTPLVSSGQVL